MNDESTTIYNENKLAYEIANALKDKEALPLYLTFTRKYQESFLRKILTRVMSIPEEKIKRTRGALFTYLVNAHGSNHSRN
jgi:hypothetical protein